MAKEIIYSEEAVARGKKCGQKMIIFMRDPREDDEADYAACKVELFLWLGNAKYVGSCWSAIPPGYEVDYETGVDSFPKFLEYTQSSVRHEYFIEILEQGRVSRSSFRDDTDLINDRTERF